MRTSADKTKLLRSQTERCRGSRVTSGRGIRTNREDLPCHPAQPSLGACSSARHYYGSGRGAGNRPAAAKQSGPRLGRENTSTALPKSPALPQFASDKFKKQCWAKGGATGTGSFQTPRDYGRGVFSLETGRLNGQAPEDCNIVIGEQKVKTKAFALSDDQTPGSTFTPPLYFNFFFF